MLDFLATKVYTYIMGYISEVIDLSPKMGRPTDNPKGKPIHVRLDDKTVKILDKYTVQENISKAEAIRRGIAKLETDIKE